MSENTVLSIDNWNEICSQFSKMFEGLGEIESNEEYVSYNSIPPYVATGITVNKQGIIHLQICHYILFKQSMSMLNLTANLSG